MDAQSQAYVLAKLVGRFVLYTPQRVQFLLSSNTSTTQRRSNRKRPCLVIGVTADRNPKLVIVPLTSAPQPGSGLDECIASETMTALHWTTVGFKFTPHDPVNNSHPALSKPPKNPVVEGGSKLIVRVISDRLSEEELQSEVYLSQLQEQYAGFRLCSRPMDKKPCYIWVADHGEEVSFANVLANMHVYGDGFFGKVETSDLNKLRQEMEQMEETLSLGGAVLNPAMIFNLLPLP